ncbi:MAG: hypothetical protein AAFX39_04220 [Pseudomonadota bacterium]
MRGIVLAFNPDDDLGVLRAEDGRRYRFSAGDWREPRPPRKRDEVDFEQENEIARDIYVLVAGPVGHSLGEGVWRDARALIKRGVDWFRVRPEAAFAALILIAAALPFYAFLREPASLIGIGAAIGDLSSALDTLRQLAQPSALATTAVGLSKLLLILFYLLLLLPLLAAWVLYRTLAGLSRRRAASVLGGLAVVSPLAIPLTITGVGAALILPEIAPSARPAVSGSLFDLAGLGVLRTFRIGAVLTIAAGIGLLIWTIRQAPSRKERRRSDAPISAVSRAAPRPDRPRFQLPPVEFDAGLPERDTTPENALSRPETFAPKPRHHVQTVRPAKDTSASEDHPYAAFGSAAMPAVSASAELRKPRPNGRSDAAPARAFEGHMADPASVGLDDLTRAFDDLVGRAEPVEEAGKDQAVKQPAPDDDVSRLFDSDDTERMMAEIGAMVQSEVRRAPAPIGRGASDTGDRQPGDRIQKQPSEEIPDMPLQSDDGPPSDRSHDQRPDPPPAQDYPDPAPIVPDAPARPRRDNDLGETHDTKSVMRLYSKLRLARLAQLDQSARRISDEPKDDD